MESFSLDQLPALMDKAKLAIDVAGSFGEVKAIRDQAERMRQYARNIDAGLEAQNRCAEIKLRAERKMGKELAAIELNKGGQGENRYHDGTGSPTLAELGISNKNLSSRWQKIGSLDDDRFEQYLEDTTAAATGEITSAGCLRLYGIARQEEKAHRKQFMPEWLPDISDRYELIHSDLNDAQIEPESIDCIITDPPYPKEFLGCYSDLATKAVEWLKPGGSLLAMAGQSYLPQVMEALQVEGLNYQWTLAYMTPGGQAVQIWPRRVNTFWKPVFWFVKGTYEGDWIGDVAKSQPNDNDKRFHEWGQSESGMADLVERFTDPGQTVCDPFLGGGTTGAVCVSMGRLFVGIDSDGKAYETATERMAGCRIKETNAA